VHPIIKFIQFILIYAIKVDDKSQTVHLHYANEIGRRLEPNSI